jgi:hypothetical protein
MSNPFDCVVMLSDDEDDSDEETIPQGKATPCSLFMKYERSPSPLSYDEDFSQQNQRSSMANATSATSNSIFCY